VEETEAASAGTGLAGATVAAGTVAAMGRELPEVGDRTRWNAEGAEGAEMRVLVDVAAAPQEVAGRGRGVVKAGRAMQTRGGWIRWREVEEVEAAD
tara:strand:+ start:5996 stop:6283 length:288 start_codon:yes stop_codon:yes gene_type:complete